MAIFQSSVLKKFLKQQDEVVVMKAYKKFTKYFHDPVIQQNIRESKEEQFQAKFLDELFVQIFGYTLSPQKNFNLTTEFKNIKNSRKADGAILKDNKALAVIELKSTKTKDLESIRQQAFDYKANQPGCVYVITSNFEKVRFYINNAVDFEEFDLFNIPEDRFRLMYLCLDKDNLLKNVPLKIKEASVLEEEAITKKFYADYSLFKRELYRDLVKRNMRNEVFRNILASEESVSRADKNIKLTLFKKSQKLLDRFLFLFFGEDRGLLPPNSVPKILEQWEKLKELDEFVPLYDRYKKYFNYLNKGWKGKDYEIFAYNGGLFKSDPILDSIAIDDELLFKHTSILTNYDFESQVDVNILGHIFENSLNEIESVNAEIEGVEFDKQKTKRKKDGVFYTPKYITKYIVDNTIGKLCEEKKAELGVLEDEYLKGRKNRPKATIAKLDEQLTAYREWLLNITICDPACGSGAFLNQALEFLITEHRWIDEMHAKLLGGGIVFQDIENSILEKNIYGVDLNEESVEIAKLSLWLRTAQVGRKLTSLNNNIKCGNSLIDSKSVAGDKAFSWEKEFPEVFTKGGFDVVIGNPPYVRAELFVDDKEYLESEYSVYTGNADLYVYFYELGFRINKTRGRLGYIAPNKWIESNYGTNLRNFFIENQCLYKCLDFGEAKIFDGVGTFPSIVFLSKDENKDQINFVKFSDIGFIRSGDLNSLDSIFVEYNSLSENKWVLDSAEITELLEKLKAKHLSLKERIGDKLLAGVKTGANKLFIYNKEQVQEITNGDPKELMLFRPICFGKDVVKYGINDSGKFLFFPYVFNDGKQQVVRIEEYPNTQNYLLSKRDDMEKRAIIKDGIVKGTHLWYELQQVNKLFNYDDPKIIYPDIALENRFTLDESGIIPDMTCFFIPTNEPSFLPILNSRMFKFLASKFCPVLGDIKDGGRIRYKSTYLYNIPFPSINKSKSTLIELSRKREVLTIEHSSKTKTFLMYVIQKYSLEKFGKKLENWPNINFNDFIKELNKAIKTSGGEKLTKADEMEWMELFESKKKDAQDLKAEIDKTDKKIDQMVYELYGLSEEEIKIVEGQAD